MVTDGCLEAMTAMGRFPASFAFLSASSTDPIPILVAHGLTVRVALKDPASQLLLMEERAKRLAERLRGTEVELLSARSQLIIEMEKNMKTQSDLCKYMSQVFELQQAAMKSSPADASSKSVFPSASCLRSAHTSASTGLPHSEWIRLGFNQVLVAAMFGELKTLEWLFALGTSLSSTSTRGEDAVFLAAEFGQLEVLQWLVKQGAKRVGFKDAQGFTALHVAVANNHANVVEWMLQNGWNPKELLRNGDTIVHIAARLGHAKVLSVALRACASLVSVVNAENEIALHVAAKNNQVECARTLLQSREGLEARDRLGLTPLLAGVMCGSEAIVALMLGFGASLSETDLDGSTAFILACFKGNLALAHRLLELGAHVNECNKDGNSALSIASYTGNGHVVEWLLSKGADVALTNSAGNTPLFLAAYGGHLEIARILELITPLTDTRPHEALTTAHRNMDSSASSATLNTEGSSSLTDSMDISDTKLTLSQESTNVSESSSASVPAFAKRRNRSGSTLLHIAAMLGNVPFINWCLSMGSSLEEKDNMGITPLIASCISDKVEALSLLISKGSVLTQLAHDGVSPLQIAAYFGSCSIIAYLIEKKKVVHNTPNENGTTPLMFAAMNGHFPAAQLLIKYGVTVRHRIAAARVARDNGFSQLADYLTTRAYSRSLILDRMPPKPKRKLKKKEVKIQV